MWWKQHKWKVLAPVLIAAVLAAAFWYGGGAPGLQGWTVHKNSPPPAAATPAVTDTAAPTPSVTPTPEASIQHEPSPLPAPTPGAPVEAAQPSPSAPPLPGPQATPGGVESRPGGEGGGMTADEKVAAAAAIAGGSSPGVMKGDKKYSEGQGMVINATTGKDKYLTDPVPEGKPLPVEPQDAAFSDTARTCTLSISCATILGHIDWLDPEKVELVPEDGWILKPTQVTFYEGESVFNVLWRTCKQQKIHLEFVDTPLYNSAYIEGIHNLYEFDCGELSGWMYRVDDWFPNYGCSRYQLKDGDVIEWVYTCDLGVDVGGFYSTGG